DKCGICGRYGGKEILGRFRNSRVFSSVEVVETNSRGSGAISFIGCDGARGSCERASESWRSYEGDVSFCINRATGSRPGRSPRRSPGGVLSPRSGRRSPIRVLPGGQAARTNLTPAKTARRLTSRQVPDCLRCPAEERTHHQ